MTKINKNAPCKCGSGRKYKKCHGMVQVNQEPRLLPRHEVWRLQYRSRRYLEYLSEEELVERGKDLIANMTTLTDELKIGLHPVHEEGEDWMIAWTHVLEECLLRNYNYPKPFANNLKDTQMPKYDWTGLSSGVEAFKKMNLEAGSYLIKYGQYEYLRSTLEKGTIRIMPASSYDDPSLNPAIRDKELTLSTLALPSEVALEAFDEKTGKSKGYINPIGNVTYTIESQTNYYAYCLAHTYSYRMFGDFEADCCLIIKQPQRFIERVIEKFNEKMPEYEAHAENIRYFDPLNIKATETELNVYFWKHFRYSYQKEYRIIWVPKMPTMQLDPVFLDLGNLEDYCDIVRLTSK